MSVATNTGSLSLLLALFCSACVVNPVPTPGKAGGVDPVETQDALFAADSGGTGQSGADMDAGGRAADAGADGPDAAGDDSDGASGGDVLQQTDAGPVCPPLTGAMPLLFLGNSYTSVNDLPAMVQQLSGSLGETVDAVAVTKGGWTLGAPPNDHASDAESLGQLGAKPWHAVVLQEQSQLPAIAPHKAAFMMPGAKKLAAKLRAVNGCAKVLFFLTWGRKAGGKQCAGGACSDDFADFGQMQDALTAAYLEAAKQVDGAVVPVGEAWREAIANGGIELFSADGSHPSVAGSYLAAATFHAALFKQSPAGASYTAGLSAADAAKLLAVGAATVLDDGAKWGL